MLKPVVFVIAVAVILYPTDTFGCSLSPLPLPPICERFWEGDAVALVEVIDIHESKTNNRRVTLRVLDVFRGNPPLELTIKDPWTSCGVAFGHKAQYLAWLTRDRDTWTAYGDRAAAEGGNSQVAEDLRYAQEMKHAPATARVFGTVDRSPALRFGTTSHEMPTPNRTGAIIVATGDGGTYQAAVNSDSKFELAELVPGKYMISVLGLPRGLSVIPEEVTVVGGACKQMYLFSGSSAEISGRVFGSGKKPETAQVKLIPVGAHGGDRSRENKVFVDTDSGNFEFKHVEPGQYVLGFELEHSPSLGIPYASRYYLDAKDLASAKVVEVKENQKITDIEFDLGREVPRRLVHVKVTWPDGSPVYKATAYLRDAHNPYSSVADEQTETDDHGEATLEGFIDTDYDVDANAVCRGNAATRDVKKKIIPAGTSEAFVNLRVPGRKCVLVGNKYLEELEKLQDRD